MPVYSHSRLSAFEKCPRLYKYTYIDRVPREGETIEAFMGSRVHEALWKLYLDLIHSKLNTLDEILSYYNESWEKKWSDDVRIVKDYTADNYREIGANCIADYYTRYKPFNQSRTLGLERKIEIELEGYRLMGFMDRLAESAPGCYEIHDYKTSQYLPMRENLMEDRQLALYQIGIEKAWGPVEKTELVWHYLVHDKEIRIRHRDEEISRFKSETIALIEKLERAVEEDDFPARDSDLCQWCSYQSLCPTQKHAVDISDLPPNKYLNDPGVKLVNEFARLMREKKEYLMRLEAELEQVREAIIAFAEREGVEVILGSDMRLRVKKVSRIVYPSKEEASRTELDELLKDGGVWMDVSDLNPYTLNRLLNSGEWSRDLVKEIKKFQRVEESYRFYLSKLNND